MEECAAYGTVNTQKTRGRRDIAVGECPACGVLEVQQREDEDDAYEITTLTCRPKVIAIYMQYAWFCLSNDIFTMQINISNNTWHCCMF